MPKKSRLRQILAVQSSLMAVLGGSPIAVSAADVSDDQGQGSKLEEIIVTAQRREENVMAVPMSVQAFSQVDLDQQGLKSIDDLTRVAPGVLFLRGGTGYNSNYDDGNSDISIRGVDSSGGAAVTGIYIDDTPIVFRRNPLEADPYPALFDLERVEVLKGPQGTLFGSGSMGGAVRFISTQASLTDYSGYARAEFGQIDNGGQNYEAGAAFGGPIIDSVLGFRVSASFREDGGWVDRVDYTRPSSVTALPTVTNVTESNANWHDTATFRAALKWQPIENLTVDPSFYIQTLHINDTGAYWPNLSDPSSNVYNNGNVQRGPSTDPLYLGAIKLSWNLPWANLVSDTSYFRRDRHSEPDYSQFIDTALLGNAYPPVGNRSTGAFTVHQSTFTQEIRLSSIDPQARIQWTGGVFYAHAYASEPDAIYIYDPSFAATEPPNDLAFNNFLSKALDRQLAAFGELTFKLSRLFSFTAGLRYSRLDFADENQQTAYGALGGGTTVTTTSTVSSTNKPLTPRFVLKYQPDEDSLYYVSAAKGFRSGGANAPFPQSVVTLCGAQAPSDVAPDSVWQYEIGSKNTLLDRHLQISASAYYFKWKDIQQQVYLSCGYGFGGNLGDAIGKGGDITVAWRATRDLSFGVTAAYTDTVYQDIVSLPGFSGSFTTVRSGDHLPAYPWNGDVNAEYDFNVANKPYIRLDYQFTSAQRSLIPYQDPANAPSADPTLPGLPETRILAARVGLRAKDFDVSLFVQNALNYHTPSYVSRDVPTTPLNGFPVNFDTNYFARGYAPRTIGMTAIYRF